MNPPPLSLSLSMQQTLVGFCLLEETYRWNAGRKFSEVRSFVPREIWPASKKLLVIWENTLSHGHCGATSSQASIAITCPESRASSENVLAPVHSRGSFDVDRALRLGGDRYLCEQSVSFATFAWKPGAV